MAQMPIYSFANRFPGSIQDFFCEETYNRFSNSENLNETRMIINEIPLNGHKCLEIIDPVSGLHNNFWFDLYKTFARDDVLVLGGSEFRKIEFNLFSEQASKNIVDGILYGRKIDQFRYIAVGILEDAMTHLSCAVADIEKGKIIYFNPSYYSIEYIEFMESEAYYDITNPYFHAISTEFKEAKKFHIINNNEFNSKTNNLRMAFRRIHKIDWIVEPLTFFPDFCQPPLSCSCVTSCLFFIDAKTRPDGLHFVCHDTIIRNIKYRPCAIMEKRKLLYFFVSGIRHNTPFSIRELFYFLERDISLALKQSTYRDGTGRFIKKPSTGSSNCLEFYMACVYYFLTNFLPSPDPIRALIYSIRQSLANHFQTDKFERILKTHTEARGILIINRMIMPPQNP